MNTLKIALLVVAAVLGTASARVISSKASSQALESPPYTVVNTFQNGIEERLYAPQKWSTVEKIAPAGAMDNVKGDMFNALLGYISGNNANGAEIAMTKPVSTKVQEVEGGMSYEMGFYIPQAFQSETPEPTDANVKIVERALRVYSISFPGFATENKYNAKLQELNDFLKAQSIPQSEESARYFVAYNSPYELFNRKNEVWVEVA